MNRKTIFNTNGVKLDKCELTAGARGHDHQLFLDGKYITGITATQLRTLHSGLWFYMGDHEPKDDNIFVALMNEDFKADQWDAAEKEGSRFDAKFKTKAEYVAFMRGVQIMVNDSGRHMHCKVMLEANAGVARFKVISTGFMVGEKVVEDVPVTATPEPVAFSTNTTMVTDVTVDDFGVFECLRTMMENERPLYRTDGSEQVHFDANRADLAKSLEEHRDESPTVADFVTKLLADFQSDYFIFHGVQN